MALTEFESALAEVLTTRYVEGRRPPQHLREKVDLAFKIQDQSVVVYEIRPCWDDPNRKMQSEIAKTKYIRGAKIWKIYWKRANGRWVAYPPFPEVESLEEFFKVVDEDSHGCFWG